NERPLDVWIRNLINRLLQPSQFYYHKKNDPPQFLKDVYFQSTNAQIVSTHIDARQKLSGYINNTKAPETDVIQKNQIHQLIASDNTTAVAPAAASMSAPVMTAPQPVIAEPMTQPITPEPHVQSPVINTPTPIPIQTVPPIVNTSPSVVSPNTQAQTANINNPFLGGHIQNSKGIPLSNIMIYIKNHDGKILRILKSNSSGQFATYHALNPGDYLVEPKDIGQKYFFDTMKIKIDTVNPGPLTIVSKELL
ncbi:MAG TPA: hypothetical protein VK338_02510, partial [Candidatus Nitrosocosmicus sp.]|nr:hypothetical protein [Candidatus Nitrosocosmicus sp.]